MPPPTPTPDYTPQLERIAAALEQLAADQQAASASLHEDLHMIQVELTCHHR